MDSAASNSQSYLIPFSCVCCIRNLSLPACFTRVYPEVSGLAAWSENCKWYSSLPLGAVVSLFCEFCRHNPLCCFSKSVYCCLFRYRLSPETYGYILVSCLIVEILLLRGYKKL
jgi:hypothetical protein